MNVKVKLELRTGDYRGLEEVKRTIEKFFSTNYFKQKYSSSEDLFDLIMDINDYLLKFSRYFSRNTPRITRIDSGRRLTITISSINV